MCFPGGPAGGVLRSGHSVDLCRLAGLTECGLCCEIMREDGTMMRTAELLEHAGRWGVKVVTIAALQDYPRLHDKHVIREAEAKLPTAYGDFRIFGYTDDLTGESHVALVGGELATGKTFVPGSFRVPHRGCVRFGALRLRRPAHAAMKRIEQEGRACCCICVRRAGASD